MTSADSDDELWLALGNYISALSKGGVPSDRFIKLPILLITSIIYLITAISLRSIGIDLDQPYIFVNLSFVNLN